MEEEATEDQWGLQDEVELEEPTKPQDRSIDVEALKGRVRVEGQVAAKYFAAGEYEQGLQLLNRQYNLTNPAPLLQLLKESNNF